MRETQDFQSNVLVVKGEFDPIKSSQNGATTSPNHEGVVTFCEELPFEADIMHC